MSRYISIVSFILFIILLGITGREPALTQDSDPRNYYPYKCEHDNPAWLVAPEAEKFALTRLNQWRLALGVPPLQRNTLLDRVASRQTAYIRQFAPFNIDPFRTEGNFTPWHLDETGSNVLRRLERNGWPTFDNGLVIGAEIAAYFPDISQSILFWQNSPVHNRTATLAGFREVGIHTQCWKGWLLTYVVMASRPNTLTATYDPYTNSLFFGEESRGYSTTGVGFRPDFYQIQTKEGLRLHTSEWLIWNDVVQLPVSAYNELHIVFTDGITTLETDVDLRYSRTFPSQLDPSPTPTLTPSPTPTPGPSLTPVVQMPSATPTGTPVPMNGHNYDITLYFNQDYISIVNETGQRVNLEPLKFGSDEFPTFELTMAFLAQPFINRGGDLAAFPPNSCVQAFSNERFNGPGTDPASCIYRRAYRSSLQPSQRFWLRPNFTIRYGLQVIAGCQGLQVYSQRAVCGFDLPDFALEFPRVVATDNPLD